MKNCPFCALEPEQILFENNDCVAFFEKHPVSPGHLLIIPKNHREDFFSLTDGEKISLNQLIETAKNYLEKQFSPDGYNLGFNCGEAAGQSVFHCHCHLIPRYHGDTKFPKGGIRGAIPEKMFYE